MSIDKPAPAPIPSDLDKMTLPVRGTFVGKVRFTDKNGKIMEGQFEGGLISGSRFIEGRIVWPNGWTHEGKFDPDTWTLMKGTKRYVNRMAFEGTFDKDTGDLIDGTKTDKDGTVTNYKDGKPVTDTTEQASSVVVASETGTPADPTRKTKTFPDGRIAEGLFDKVTDVLIEGKITWPNGSVSTIKNGKMLLDGQSSVFSKYRKALLAALGVATAIGTGIYIDSRTSQDADKNPSADIAPENDGFVDLNAMDDTTRLLFTGEGKYTNLIGIKYEGRYENGHFIDGKKTWPDGHVYNYKGGKAVSDENVAAPSGN